MDFLQIIRQRVNAAAPHEHSIPNCDVKILLAEIDRLRSMVPVKQGGSKHPYDDDLTLVSILPFSQY